MKTSADTAITTPFVEAMTSTPPEVTDTMVANHRSHVTDAQMVELR